MILLVHSQSSSKITLPMRIFLGPARFPCWSHATCRPFAIGQATLLVIDISYIMRPRLCLFSFFPQLRITNGDSHWQYSQTTTLSRRTREGRSEERTRRQLSLLLLLNIYYVLINYIRWHPQCFQKTLRMLLIKESKTKDIDKEVRLLRRYEQAVREATNSPLYNYLAQLKH